MHGASAAEALITGCPKAKFHPHKAGGPQCKSRATASPTTIASHEIRSGGIMTNESHAGGHNQVYKDIAGQTPRTQDAGSEELHITWHRGEELAVRSSSRLPQGRMKSECELENRAPARLDAEIECCQSRKTNSLEGNRFINCRAPDCLFV
jgi:hypothetical protein